MPNTSATGGYLLPTTNPSEGVELRRFLHSVLAGVSGLAPELVRPAWQQNPPPVPSIGTDWMAYGIAARRTDANAWQQEQPDGEAGHLRRHEELDVNCTFYGDNCLALAATVRDGLEVAQNREQLYLAGMAFVDAGDVTHAPEVVNEQWYDRCDMTVTLRREVRRVYPILHFVKAEGTLNDNSWSTP